MMTAYSFSPSLNTTTKVVLLTLFLFSIIGIPSLYSSNAFAGTGAKDVAFDSTPPQVTVTSKIPLLEVMFDISSTMNTATINASKTATTNMINNMKSQNYTALLGISAFDKDTYGNGLKLIVEPDFINKADHVTKLQNAISQLKEGGGTPLARAHVEFLHYLAGITPTGMTSRRLTYNPYNPIPGTGLPKTGLAETLLTCAGQSNAPNQCRPFVATLNSSRAITGATGITSSNINTLANAKSPFDENTKFPNASCFEPHLILFNDIDIKNEGFPTALNTLTSDVPAEASTQQTQLARSAHFGANTDLRPDLDGIQNLITHFVLFTDETTFNANTYIKNVGYYGGGGHYRATTEDGTTLTRIFNDIISKIALPQQEGKAGTPVFASQTASDNNKICYSTYNATNWSGDVECYSFDKNGKIGSASPPTTPPTPPAPLWSAAQQLKNMTKSDRVMLTYEATKGTTALNTAGTAASPTPNYVLRNLSGTGFRTLPPVADILDAKMDYIGEPLGNWDVALKNSLSTLATAYKTFKADQNAKTPMVCAGSESPLRQCFDATTGKEVFAYLPSGTTRVDQYVKPGYIHQAYNSGPSVVEDTVITIGTSASWKTIYLFCGGRSPDKQCTALDVTSRSFSNTPSSSTVNVLWEATNWTTSGNILYNNDATKPAIGNILTTPAIILHKNGVDDGTVKSFSLLPNGYNSKADGACLIVIDNKPRTSWTAADYRVICDTTVGQADDAATSVRAVDVDGDDLADYAYLTTAKGRILRVDLAGAFTGTDWKMKVVADLGLPINAKALVIKPSASAKGLVNTDKPNLLVLVGTGRFLVNTDRIDTTSQYFVSLLDKNDSTITLEDLVDQSLKAESGGYLSLSGNNVDYSSTLSTGKKVAGAKIQLTGGNRVLMPAQLYGDVVVFNTITPGQFSSGSTCAVTAPNSSLIIADATKLSSPANPVIDITGEGIIDDDDKILVNGNKEAAAGRVFTGIGLMATPRIIGDVLIENPDSTEDSIIIKLGTSSTSASSRRSWQELRQ